MPGLFDDLVPAQGAPPTQSGEALTPQQATYATANANYREPGAPGGSVTNPSYVTPAHPAVGQGYEVNPQGQMSDPSASANLFADLMPGGRPIPQTSPRANFGLKDTLLDAGGGLLSGLTRAEAGIADAVEQASPLGSIQQMLSMAGALSQGELPKVQPYNGVSSAIGPKLYAPQTKAGEYSQTIGEMAPNAAAPGGILRKAASVVLPGIASQASGDVAQAAGANPLGVAAARFLGGALGGVAAGAGVARPAPKTPATTLDQLRAKSDAAWAKVDASGYRFPSRAVSAAADDIGQLVAEAGGPELYQKADAMARRIKSLSEKDGLSVAQLNRLRSQVGTQLMQPGSTEADIGGAMRERLDALIEDSKDPTIAEARGLYTRLKKAEAVSNQLDSAELRTGGAHSGKNGENTTRSKLIPLVDPTSSKRVRNFTPEEEAQVRSIITGSPGRNLMRGASKATGNKFVQTGVMMVTPHGVGYPLLEAASTGLRKVGEANTQRAVDGLMSTIIDGKKPVSTLPKLTYKADPLAPLNLGTILGLPRAQPAPAQARHR